MDGSPKRLTALDLPPDWKAAIEEAKASLVNRFGPRLQAMIIFGSQVWGRPDGDSDVDVCVVIDALSSHERGEAIDLVSEVALTREVPLTALVWSQADLDYRVRGELQLALDITTLGVAV